MLVGGLTREQGRKQRRALLDEIAREHTLLLLAAMLPDGAAAGLSRGQPTSSAKRGRSSRSP
jgi:hypothetical protein